MPFYPQFSFGDPLGDMGRRGLMGPQLPPGLAPTMSWQAPQMQIVNRAAKGDMLQRLPMRMPTYGAMPEGLLGMRGDQAPIQQRPAPAPVQPRAKPARVLKPAAKKKARLSPHMRREMMIPGFGPSG